MRGLLRRRRHIVGTQIIDVEFARAGAVAGVQPQAGNRLAFPGWLLPQVDPVLVKTPVGDDLEPNRLAFVNFG